MGLVVDPSQSHNGPQRNHWPRGGLLLSSRGSSNPWLMLGLNFDVYLLSMSATSLIVRFASACISSWSDYYRNAFRDFVYFNELSLQSPQSF